MISKGKEIALDVVGMMTVGLMVLNWLVGLPSILTFVPAGLSASMVVGCALIKSERWIIRGWVLIGILNALIAFNLDFVFLKSLLH